METIVHFELLLEFEWFCSIYIKCICIELSTTKANTSD